jgi:CHAT domain-containing protein
MPLLVVACLAAAGPAPAARAAEGCAPLLAEDPAGRAASSCLHGLAREGGAEGERAELRLREIADRHREAPWPSFYLGLLAWDDTRASAAHFERAAAAFGRTGDATGEVYARENRAQQLFRLGLTDAADREAETAARVAMASGDPDLESHGRVALARQLAQRGGDLDRAERLLRGPADGDDGEPCTGGPARTRIECLLTLGNITLEQGRVRTAERIFRDLAALSVEVGFPAAEAAASYGIARVAVEELAETPSDRGLAAVRERARAALEAARRAGNADVEAKAHWILGVLDPGPDGRGHLETCSRVARTDRDRSYCLNALARHLTRADPDRAVDLVERALELAREAKDSWSQAFAWRELMRVRWRAGPAERAVEDSWEALDAIERLRDLQPEGSAVQAGLFSTWADDYSWLLGRILDEAGRGLPEEVAVREAFRVGERERARALTDWLRRTDAPLVRAVEARELSRPDRFAGLDRVRAALAPEEAFLAFQIAPWEDLAGDFGGGSWLMVVTRDRVRVHRLPGRLEVRRAVWLFEGLLERRDGAEAGPSVHLYDTLLAPALAELPPEVERLILVPDDALHRLPFAALRSSDEAEPLGFRYELARAPSATLWLHWRQERPAPPERPLLVLADPDLAGSDLDDSDLTEPGAGPAGDPRIAQARGPAAFRGETFGRLPHARREGRAAVRALGGGLLLIGPEASEEALTGLDLRSFGLLHFAAHAVTDEDHPERSAVLLAAGSAGGRRGRGGDAVRTGRGGGRDGLLEAGEIAGLDLGGRTVVLASCRSADGTVLRGEGVMSLARAFFQAGAHGVIASLWPLRDDESAALFDRFYRRLADGATVGQALHGARREAIEAGEPAAGWAGLVVLGDGGAVPVPGGRRGVPGGALAASAAVLLIVAAVLVWRVRRRRGG